jgi:hypothetical protein
MSATISSPAYRKLVSFFHNIQMHQQSIGSRGCWMHGRGAFCSFAKSALQFPFTPPLLHAFFLLASRYVLGYVKLPGLQLAKKVFRFPPLCSARSLIIVVLLAEVLNLH